MDRSRRKHALRFTILALALALLGALSGAGAARAAETSTSCTPVDVMAFAVGSKRIHVRCAQSVNGIRFFALNNTDPILTSRILSVLTTAQVAGRTLFIFYDPVDLSGHAWGCLNSDCRPIRGVGFGQ